MTLTDLEQEVLATLLRAEGPLTLVDVGRDLKKRGVKFGDKFDVLGALDVVRYRGLVEFGPYLRVGRRYCVSAAGRKHGEAG